MLDKHQKSLKMIETDSLDAVCNKNQENSEIANRKCGAIFSSSAAMVFYSILFKLYESDATGCETLKAEIRKCQNESGVLSFKSGRNNELKGKCVYNPQ